MSLKRNLSLGLSVGVLILLSLGCGEATSSVKNTPDGDSPAEIVIRDVPVVQEGNRILVIDVNEPEDGNYDAAMDMVKIAGAQAVNLTVFWDDIETAPGEYNPDPNWLAVANAYYPAQNVQVSLVISVIDTTANRLPADLADKPFAAPAVIERGQRLLDYVFSQIPDLNLTSLSIGNEVDIYLGGDAALWQQYQTFYKAAAAYARSKQPGLDVGVKATYDGLVDFASDHLTAINQSSDVIMMTYYPLKGDFTVEDPLVVPSAFKEITSKYPDRPIFIMEAGYPSSSDCDSSEAKQAEFIHQVFTAWDAHADQIQLISFTWLTDLHPSSVDEMENYYGLSDHKFGEFLRTLGLRTYPGSGVEKEAFTVLKTEAASRGW